MSKEEMFEDIKIILDAYIEENTRGPSTLCNVNHETVEASVVMVPESYSVGHWSFVLGEKTYHKDGEGKTYKRFSTAYKKVQELNKQLKENGGEPRYFVYPNLPVVFTALPEGETDD